MQLNYITKKPYTKSNELLLTIQQAERGFLTPEWLTFLQARDIGLTVKKGSKGVHLARVIEDDEKKDKKFVRHFVVFNVEQVEKITN